MKYEERPIIVMRPSAKIRLDKLMKTPYSLTKNLETKVFNSSSKTRIPPKINEKYLANTRGSDIWLAETSMRQKSITNWMTTDRRTERKMSWK